MAPRPYVATLACGHQKITELQFTRLTHLSCPRCLDEGKPPIQKLLIFTMLTKNTPLPR